MIRMSEDMKKSRIIHRKLLIKDSFKNDAGRGIVRTDPSIINELNLRTGDVLEITSMITNKKTVALLYPGRREDRGSGIIRMDTSLRRNLNASLDDLVEIRKIEAQLGNSITFTGFRKAVILKNSQQLAKTLENRVVTTNDILSFYSYGKRVDLVVVDFSPKSSAVRIQKDTKIVLSENSFIDIIKKSNFSMQKAFEETMLGDKFIKKDPSKAIYHYKLAIKFNGEKKLGNLYKHLAFAFIQLGMNEQDFNLFFKAEKYFRKAQLCYKTQILEIENNLFEIDRLERKTPPYKKTLFKNFALPNFLRDN